jgi:hypothetical protein
MVLKRQHWTILGRSWTPLRSNTGTDLVLVKRPKPVLLTAIGLIGIGVKIDILPAQFLHACIGYELGSLTWCILCNNIMKRMNQPIEDTLGGEKRETDSGHY